MQTAVVSRKNVGSSRRFVSRVELAIGAVVMLAGIGIGVVMAAPSNSDAPASNVAAEAAPQAERLPALGGVQP